MAKDPVVLIAVVCRLWRGGRREVQVGRGFIGDGHFPKTRWFPQNRQNFVSNELTVERTATHPANIRFPEPPSGLAHTKARRNTGCSLFPIISKIFVFFMSSCETKKNPAVFAG
jgi:hypothetical protein